MQINRLFEIVYTLLNKNSTTTRELAEKFDVSTRTIRRDIDTLSLAGIPIYTIKGKGGGVKLLPDFVLNKSILSEDEQNAILTALHGLANIKPDEAEGALSRLSTLFNKTAINWLEVDFADWDRSNGFADLKAAILERRVVEFEYYNSYGTKTSRRVEPIQLLFKYNSWYLNAFCLTKHGLRMYKLARITNLEVTNENFTLREHDSPTLDTHEDDNRPQITFKLRISPERAFRVFDDFAEDMVEKQPDGSYIVTRTFPEDNWVYSYILSFGRYAEVLEPDYLRNIIRAEAENILSNYE